MGLFDSIRRVVGGGDTGGETATDEEPQELVDTRDLDGDDLRVRAEDVAGEVEQLDFSLASLEQFDAAIGAGYDDELHTSDTPATYDRDVVRFGCYLGEVLVRVYGGEWTDDDGWGVALTGPDDTVTVSVFEVATRSIETEPVFAAVTDRAAVEVGLDPTEVDAEQPYPERPTREGTETDDSDAVDTDGAAADSDDTDVDAEAAETDEAGGADTAEASVPADTDGAAEPVTDGVAAESSGDTDPTGESGAEAEGDTDDGVTAAAGTDGTDADHSETGPVEDTGTSAGGDDEVTDTGFEFGSGTEPPAVDDQSSAAPASDDMGTVDDGADGTDVTEREPTRDDEQGSDTDAAASGSDYRNPFEAVTGSTDEDEASESDAGEDVSSLVDEAEPERPADDCGRGDGTGADAPSGGADDSLLTDESATVGMSPDATDADSADGAESASTDAADEPADDHDPAEPTPDPTEGDGLRAEYAEEAAGFVDFWNEHDLDYSPESLERLDGLVAAEWDDERFDDATFGSEDSFDDRAFTSVAMELGSYFGEVLVRELDAEWSDQTAIDGVVVKGPSGPLAIPVFRVAGTSLKQQPVFARSYESLLDDLEG